MIETGNLPPEVERERALFELSPEERQEMEHSWGAMEEFIQRLERVSSPEVMDTVTRFEHEDDETTKQKAMKLYEFGNKFFDPIDNMDPMSYEIGIRLGLADNTVVLDENGEIISGLQSQLIEMDPKIGSNLKEALFNVWYVGTDPNYHGRPVTREIFVKALRASLEKAKAGLLKVKGITGETDPDVERIFNRYDLKRAYIKDRKGRFAEVPYEAAPEDESEGGSPQHFMMKMFDGGYELTTEELSKITSNMHAQYYRDEFLSQDYLEWARNWYNNLAEDPDDVKDDEVTDKRAASYKRKYTAKVQKLDSKFDDAIGKSVDGKVILMSERERRARVGQGETVVDWKDE
jgi:hypothetical protein